MLRRLIVSMFLVGAACVAADAQTITCSLSTPLGATGKGTATGHTEPIAAGSNATPPSAGGGTVRVTCTNNGADYAAGPVLVQISLNAPITNSTSFPTSFAGIRVSNGTGVFVTGGGGNVGINSINNSLGTINIWLGTPVATASGTPTTGVTFPANSTSSFDLNGVLVSLIGKSSVTASLTLGSDFVTVTHLAPGVASVTVISTITSGIADPTLPTGPAIMGSDGTLFQGGFTIRIQENYASMFRAADQFNGGIGGVFPQSGASSVQLNILFNNIPQGFDISGCDVVETYSNGTASTGLAFMNFSSVSAFLPVLTVVLASPQDLANIEVITLTCTNVSKGSAILPLNGPDITAQVSLAPVGAALSNSGGVLTSLTTGSTPRYQQVLQPATPLTVVSF